LKEYLNRKKYVRAGNGKEEVMRVTYSMMVKNMAYWSSKQSEKLNNAETIVASGKQVNKPSDDPEAAGQILADRTTISKYAQYESNISQAQTWIEESDTTLSTVSTLLQDAKDILSSVSSADSTTKASYLQELTNIYNEVISYANTSSSSGYMYSGNDSTVMPFANNVQVSGGTASDIVFDLSGAATDVSIEITDSTGTVVRTLTATSGVEGTNTIAWDGCDDSGTTLSDGNYNFTVTASNSAGDAVASYPSYRGGEGGKIVITGENSSVVLNNNGGEIFSNALNVLSQTITVLNNTDTSSTVISDLSASLKDAVSQIETEEVALSNKNALLGNSTSRLDELTTYVKSRISDTENCDTTTASAELTAQETAYETTESATASVLKMSTLKDYLS